MPRHIANNSGTKTTKTITNFTALPRNACTTLNHAARDSQAHLKIFPITSNQLRRSLSLAGRFFTNRPASPLIIETGCFVCFVKSVMWVRKINIRDIVLCQDVQCGVVAWNRYYEPLLGRLVPAYSLFEKIALHTSLPVPVPSVPCLCVQVASNTLCALLMCLYYAFAPLCAGFGTCTAY